MNSLLIEYLRPNRSPVKLADLGLDFISLMGLPLANAGRPFRIQGEAKYSHTGIPYFEYEHSGLALPDGLDTVLQVNGCAVRMSHVYASHSGRPTRYGKERILLHGEDYEVFVLIAKGQRQYCVKVHARRRDTSTRPPGNVLSGGRIV